MRETFHQLYPDIPLFEAGGVDLVARYLTALGWLDTDETVVSCDKAGEGNMNLTLRIETESRSAILKQSRPWVEKYDSIAAPFDRALVEAAFYTAVGEHEAVSNLMPKLLEMDALARVLILEDLGEASDLSTIYPSSASAPPDNLSREDLERLLGYLRALSELTRGTAGRWPLLENRAMRKLNHEHMFVVPMDAQNGLDLEVFEPGLSSAAEGLRADLVFCDQLEALGERYLKVATQGGSATLLHGDFYPGSWVRAQGSIRVIDPEFCFFGDSEFDLAIPLAHFLLAGRSDLAREWVASAQGGKVDEDLWARYAGVEIIRRLLGVAQLPIAPSSGRRAALVERARKAVREGALKGLLA